MDAEDLKAMVATLDVIREMDDTKRIKAGLKLLRDLLAKWTPGTPILPRVPGTQMIDLSQLQRRG